MQLHAGFREVNINVSWGEGDTKYILQLKKYGVPTFQTRKPRLESLSNLPPTVRGRATFRPSLTLPCAPVISLLPPSAPALQSPQGISQEQLQSGVYMLACTCVCVSASVQLSGFVLLGVVSFVCQ